MKKLFAYIPFVTFAFACPIAFAQTWNRHAIDDQYQGADGVRMGDFNHDGLPDIVTGWEESGLVRLYLHPGFHSAKQAWPAVTLGELASPEDAAAIDLDRDGQLDVLSCHEGKTRQVVVHWNRTNGTDQMLLQSRNWTRKRFQMLDGQQWMFAASLGHSNGRPLIAVGSKNKNASITLLIGPTQNYRDMDQWNAIRLRDVGWVMSIQAIDMDGDQDLDLVFSDRKGDQRGAAWLEQPIDVTAPWIEHPIGASDQEAMFLDARRDRCLVATRDGVFFECEHHAEGWSLTEHQNPSGISMGKAIAALSPTRWVMTTNTVYETQNPKPGIWVQDQKQRWQPIDPTTRVKFDRIELVDLDGDGDLDVITCEERRNLGIVWYENPDIRLSDRRSDLIP